MPLEGLRWSRDSGSALCDTSQNSRSRTGWGGKLARALFTFFRGTSDGIAGDGGRKGGKPLPAPLRLFLPRCAPFPAILSLVLKKREKNLVVSE